MKTKFTEQTGAELPIICGAMYPCSNPELVAAASEHGASGVVQPLSLTYVHGYDFVEGLRKIRSLTQKPIGLNLLIEASSKTYLERNKVWLNQALDEGVRFFVTALGNPDWVVDIVHKKGGIVYHDVTERRFADKALKAGVDGLICVNNRAGGHAGSLADHKLFEDLKDLGVPLICAGGVGGTDQFKKVMAMGYQGVQMGTRFIASAECTAHTDYKTAIVGAKEKDIVLSEKITGVPVSVINTPYVQKMGTKPNAIAQKLLKRNQTKHLMRLFYSVKSIIQLKKSSKEGSRYKDYFQAGKSVEDINKVQSVKEILAPFHEV